jgi:hypothetical protein
MSLIVKYAKQVRFRSEDEGGAHEIDYEARDIVVGFEERRRDYELVDGTLVQKVEYYRFFLTLRSPYLRRGTLSTSPGDPNKDFITLLQELDEHGSVEVSVPEYATGYYEVVKGSSGIDIATNRQVVIPELDYTFRAKGTVATLPNWMQFTRPRPGYLQS